MMNYYGGRWGMMGGGDFGGLFGIITWIVVIVDLVLLGVWLWKKISSK